MTLRVGTHLFTPKDDLNELRSHLQTSLQIQLQQIQTLKSHGGVSNTGTVEGVVGATAGTNRRLDLNPMFR